MMKTGPESSANWTELDHLTPRFVDDHGSIAEILGSISFR